MAELLGNPLGTRFTPPAKDFDNILSTCFFAYNATSDNELKNYPVLEGSLLCIAAANNYFGTIQIVFGNNGNHFLRIHWGKWIEWREL